MAEGQDRTHQQRSRVPHEGGSIKQILSGLKEDEAFFSIDEYGPFAIKRKGGSKRVGPGENYVVPNTRSQRAG